MFVRSFMMGVFIFGTFSCVESNNNLRVNKDKPQVISTKKLAVESEQEYAERMVRVGEILVNNPVGALQAGAIFDDVLKIDPTNNKALFYSAFTDILKSFKGVVNRSRDLMEDPEDYKIILNYLKTEMKYPEYINFVVGNSNQEKFKNYQDIKKFVQEDVTSALEKASDKLDSINGDFELILTQLKTKNTEYEYDCQTYDDGDGYGEYTECSLKEEMQSVEALPAEYKKVDANDLKMISGAIRAYASFFTLMGAYSIEGQEHLTNEIKLREMELQRSLTDREEHRIVRKYSQYLSLEKNHRLNKLTSNLEKVIQAAMDLEALGNRYCESDARAHHLIDSICFDQDARVGMIEALELLAGPKEIDLLNEVDSQTGQETKVSILMDLNAFLSNPINDIKSLMSYGEYDDEGNFQLTKEPELNGLFPNNDLIKKLEQIRSLELR